MACAPIFWDLISNLISTPLTTHDLFSATISEKTMTRK